MEYHIETLPKDTKAVLTSLKQVAQLQNFYLSGGTALALHLGHRESEDLDFFTEKLFQPELIQQKLLTYGSLSDVSIEEGTLNCFMNEVKLQFLYYPYPLLEKLLLWDNLYLSSTIDIACTKLMTVSMRGSKKDFIDIYFLLQSMTLEELFTKLEKKYQKTNYNYPHILKSLVYFEDAEAQPMPRMHRDIKWENVKQFLIEKVKDYSF